MGERSPPVRIIKSLAHLAALPLCFGLLFGASNAAAQPFADGPDGKTETKPKPKRRAWTVKEGQFAYSLEFNPGIPDPNKVVEIHVFATKIPSTPHPRYGNRIPLKGATFTVEAFNPAGESVGRFRAHALPLQAGRYGLHITPTQEGIYELIIAGKSAEGEQLKARLKMPVKVWPLPKELEGSGADVGGGPRRRAPVVKKR